MSFFEYNESCLVQNKTFPITHALTSIYMRRRGGGVVTRIHKMGFHTLIFFIKDLFFSVCFIAFHLSKGGRTLFLNMASENIHYNKITIAYIWETNESILLGGSAHKSFVQSTTWYIYKQFLYNKNHLEKLTANLYIYVSYMWEIPMYLYDRKSMSYEVQKISLIFILLWYCDNLLFYCAYKTEKKYLVRMNLGADK